MAHVSNTFKEVVLGGGFYFAKTGHDSNNGTTPDTPKATWSNLILGGTQNYSRVQIIASGHYRSSNVIGDFVVGSIYMKMISESSNLSSSQLT
jgi:hypothetical protein